MKMQSGIKSAASSVCFFFSPRPQHASLHVDTQLKARLTNMAASTFKKHCCRVGGVRWPRAITTCASNKNRGVTAGIALQARN